LQEQFSEARFDDVIPSKKEGIQDGFWVVGQFIKQLILYKSVHCR